MSDILLQKPAAGQNTTLAPQAGDRLVFEFDSSEATLLRDGDSLIMNFEDGAHVSLIDFYVTYTSENMPTFLIEEAEIDGKSFFATLDEELMPAAGDASWALQGSGASTGDEAFYGDEGDDILYGGEGDDLLFADFTDTAYGASGNDMILFDDVFADLSGLDAATIFMDAGNDGSEEMDTLLTGATDLDTVKGLLERGNIMGMEVIVDTQDVDIAHKVLEDIGEHNLTHWNATDITVSSKDGTYRQFTSGEDDNKLTILVNMPEFIG